MYKIDTDLLDKAFSDCRVADMSRYQLQTLLSDYGRILRADIDMLNRYRAECLEVLPLLYESQFLLYKTKLLALLTRKDRNET